MLFVGEVKATDARVGIGELDRLDRAVAQLDTKTAKRDRCRRILVSKSGFTTDLERVASRRDNIELVDLHRLYHGD